MLRSIAVVFAMLGALIASAAAQEPSRSECLAMANAPRRATPVSLRRLAAKADRRGAGRCLRHRKAFAAQGALRGRRRDENAQQTRDNGKESQNGKVHFLILR